MTLAILMLMYLYSPVEGNLSNACIDPILRNQKISSTLQAGNLVKTLVNETGIVFVSGEAFGFPKEKLIVMASFVDFLAEEALSAYDKVDQNVTENLFSSNWTRNIDQSILILDTWLNR